MKTDYSRPRELHAGEVLRLLLGKLKWLLFWGAAAGVLAGLATAWFVKPVYRAQTTLYVYASRQSDGVASSSELTAARNLAAAYREVLQSQTVCSAVCDYLHGAVEVSQLERMVEITVADDAPLLRIEAVAPEPGLSRDIAAAFAAVGPVELARVMRDGGADVLDEARLPTKAEGPHAVKSGIFAMAAGMTAAAAWFVLCHVYGSTIRTAEDIRTHTWLPVLGQIPASDRDGEAVPAAGLQGELWIQMAGSLLLERSEERCPVFLVTGPGSAAGKSLAAANLAAGFAALGRRTVLVDCDLRSPCQHRLWGVKKQGGLRNLLEKDGKCELHRAPGLQVWVMIAGGRVAEPARLLASQRFAEAVALLRTRYDCVILDAPPVDGWADTRFAARCADGVVLSTRAGKTCREELVEAARAMDHASICGIVVDGVRCKPGKRR